MIKTLYTTLMLLTAATVYSQNEYTIQGKIIGLEDSTEIRLYRSDGSVMSPIAKDTVIDESFCFKGMTSEDKPETLMITGGAGFPNTWLDV